ncbi:MAG: dual specificity protein phosphatase family protein [Thaumarchaeota archaeon]|nr:dual specificity protein phosphatase family protein [Nitrososphaerota archaeon]
MGTGGVFLRKLRARVSDQPTGFVWVEDRKLAASGYPGSAGQLGWIHRKGIGAILSLTEDPIRPELVEGSAMVFGHVSMKDHEVPDKGSLDLGVAFILGQLKEGRSILVHCLAGEGRTGCVLAAYLISTRGLGAPEALKTLREIKPLFVERSQERALFDYALGAKS